MRKNNLRTIIIIAILCINGFYINPVFALPAFPGAEGFGSDTIGGRNANAVVYKVTNLNNSGAGSFRAAVEASGPRYVVFAVSGDIHLTTQLEINNPYITIAGQTSPGGISVSGRMFQVSTHDVIITHMHFRRGTNECSNICSGYNCSCAGGYGDAVRVMNNGSNDAYNIILDHCSIAWGDDETLDVSAFGGETYDVTVSNCIIGQGCDNTSGSVTGMESNHALGVVLSGVHRVGSTELTVSFHHNYVANFRYRFPNTGKGYFDVYDNVLYNYEQYTAEHAIGDTWVPSSTYDGPLGRGLLNSRNNFYKQGPLIGYYDSCTYQPGKSQGHILNQDAASGQMSGTPSAIVYSSGNIGTCFPSSATRENKYWNSYGTNGQELASGWIATAPIAAATAGDATITTMTSNYASSLISSIGANRIQSKSELQYDSLDSELISDYANSTGSWIDYTTYPTDWPAYSTANDNPTDSDNDGMWDSQETILWGNTSAHAANDVLPTGYSAMETCMQYLGGYITGGSPDATAPLAPSGLSIQ